MALSLDEDGQDFILTKTDDGSVTQRMRLSEQDVLTLGRSSRRLMAVVAERRSVAGADAVVLTPVTCFDVQTDLHKSEIHLRLGSDSGWIDGFLLSEEGSRHLLSEITAKLAEINSPKSKAH